MKKKVSNKGFTLVELIVVIAIIGILSAVLIPSIAGFIDKGYISSDTSDAKNMNLLLSTYLIENDIDGSKLDSEDVRYIIQSLDSQYTFAPKYKNGVFYYDKATFTIEYTSKINDLKKVTVSNKNSVNLSANLSTVSGYSSIDDLYATGKIYLNSKGKIAEFIERFRNVSNYNEYSRLASQANSLGLTDLYQEYSPSKTLFIGSSNVFASANTGIEKVVFATKLKTILNPNVYGKISLNPNVTVSIPLSVKFINGYAFEYISSQVTINIKSKSTLVLENAFGENVKTNARITSKTKFANDIITNNSLITINAVNDANTVYRDEDAYIDDSGALLIDLRSEAITYKDLELNLVALQDRYPTLDSFQADIDSAGNTVKLITFIAFDNYGIIAYIKIITNA